MSPLCPKTSPAKFENNQNGGYQEEVKNIQLLKHDARLTTDTDQ